MKGRALATLCVALPLVAAQARLVTLSVPEPEQRLINKQPAARSEPSHEMRLIQQASAGQREAQLELALHYFEGTAGFAQNVPQALKWFLLAARAGDRRGALGAGAVYMLYGDSPTQLRDGQYWLKRAADAGLARATYVQALALWRKTGGKRLAALDELLAQGARARDAFSINMQAALLEREGQQAAARDGYQRAAALGSPAAAANLARLRDASLFAEYRADPAGFDDSRLSPEQAYDFARRYHAGRGVPTDYLRAIGLYELSAKARYVPAQKMLSLIYSRRSPRGGLDPAWMQALANTDPRSGAGVSITTLGDDTLPAIDDRPLIDLLAPAAGRAAAPVKAAHR